MKGSEKKLQAVLEAKYPGGLRFEFVEETSPDAKGVSLPSFRVFDRRLK